MATSRNHFVNHDANPERRRNPRVAPTLLTYVSFGGSNGGMVLDVSEDGLALATALAVPDKQLLKIAIPSDQAHQLIEVTGRVVWISESKRRVGLQLVEPTAGSREFLRKWVATVMQRQPAAPFVTKIDAESCNAAAIVENCAPLPMESLANEGMDAPETQLTLDLLGTAEPLVTERPPTRGALLVMVANSATNTTQTAQTGVPQISPIPIPAIEDLTLQIPDMQIPIAEISETQIFETEIAAVQIPEMNSEESAVLGTDSEQELIAGEAAEEESMTAAPIAVYATAVPTVDWQRPVERLEVPIDTTEPGIAATLLSSEERILPATEMEAPIPVLAVAPPILSSQPSIETFELPASTTEPSSDVADLTDEEKISFSPVETTSIPIDAEALPILDSRSLMETLGPTPEEPHADASRLPSEGILFSEIEAAPIAESETVASPEVREVRDILQSLEAAESHGAPAAIPLRIASKGSAKIGPSKSSPMSSSLFLVSIAVVAVSFAAGILIGRGLLTKIFSDPATNVVSARPALLPRGKPSTHAGGPAVSAVTNKTGVTAVPAGPSSAAGGIGGDEVRAVASKSNGDSNSAAKEQDKSASEATSAGIEMMVTPNEGDAPLRVDLPEETVVQSPALEIRAERFLYVPGAAPQRNHKVRKERVVVGPLVSRVMPQIDGVSGGAQSGQQVVTVRATIDGDGHVSYVDPLDGPIALIPAVMTAVRGWRFAPSSLNREPLKTEVDLRVKFRATR